MAAIVMHIGPALVIIGAFSVWDSDFPGFGSGIRGIEHNFGIITLVLGIVSLILVWLGRLSKRKNAPVQLILFVVSAPISLIGIMLMVVIDDIGLGLIMTAIGGVATGLGAIARGFIPDSS